MMKILQGRGASRFGVSPQRSMATIAAYALVLTTVTFGTLPATPAAAAPGDADLSITKSANSGSALLGTAVEFTITITNNGPGDTTGVAVTDVLPSGFTFQSAAATNGTYDEITGQWSVGSMLLGSTQTLNVVATAASVAFATNTAAITASDQLDPVPGNNSASASINIATVPPAVCDTDDIIGISGSTIYSINVNTGVATPEFVTSQATSGGIRNALASNSDLGFVYWGSGTTVYWWNPVDDTEGVLMDLSGQINGTLESAGAAYHGGYYYFSAEIGGNANGLYRMAIDPVNGALVVAGSLEELAANEPEDSLEAILGIDARPDYGDMTVLTVNGEPVMFGSTVDAFDSAVRGHWWSYNINSGALDFIAYEPSPNHVQLGTDLNGDTWGTDASGNLYSVNQASGLFTDTGFNIGFGAYDLSGSFCVPPELAAIDLMKTVIGNVDADGSSTVSAGDTLTYEFVATNTGNIVLDGVTVTDPLSGLSSLSCSEPMPASLGTGEELTCTASYVVTASDQATGHISNTASVSGTPPSGSSVSDTSSAITTVAQPEVLITKVSDTSGPVVAGQIVTYIVTVENTGGFQISDLTITDPLPSATTYVAESTLVEGWVADASSLSLSELVAPNTGISTNCAAPNIASFAVTDDVAITDVNVGFAATHGRRGQIRVTLTSPAGTSALLMPGNSGDRDNNYDILLDAASTLPLDDGNSDNVAAPNYERLVGAANLSRFVGESSVGIWTIEVCDTVPQSADGTFNQATLFIEGDSGSTGAITKDNIPGGAVADLVDGVPPVLVSATDGLDLPIGASMSVTYQVQVDADLDGTVLDIANTATVFSPELPPTTGSSNDPIDFLPVLEIAKDGPPGPVTVGETVTYTYTVNHAATSDGSPVDVSVTDDIIDLSVVTPTGDNNLNGLLDGGETWIFTTDYTISVDAADPLVNVATVAGTDLNGTPIADATDTHTVDVDFAPALTVTKVGAPSPAAVGDTVTYTYTVAHSVASDLSPVSGMTVVDSRGLVISGPAGDGNGNSLLDSAEIWVFTATEAIVATTSDPLTNDVTVDGTDRDGEPIPPATASESVDIDFAPVVAVAKTGPASAALGDTVTYTFTVTHAPASDLSPVTIDTVTDDVAGAGTYVSGDSNGNSLLDTGEAWVFTASHTITAADPDPLANIVTVTATDLDGEPTPDATDNHSTDVEHLPVVLINKAGPASALVGETITFSFAVSHDAASDGTPISGLTVTDDYAGSATYVIGDDGDNLLESGEIWVFTASYAITAADPDPLVNTGTTTGTDRDGDPISDTDTHSTDVIPPASVGDLVWHDLDGNGVFDAGEPGLDGVTVYLRGAFGTIIDTVITPGGGAYNFTGLAPGSYTVDVDQTTVPLGAPILSAGNDPFGLTLVEGEARNDVDFGYYEVASLGDFVWDDLDGDGIQDAGEPGISGVNLVIYDAADLSIALYTTSTLGDGSYSVPVLPGDYVVEFVLPAGYVFSPSDSGADDAVDSDANTGTSQTVVVTVASGDSNATVDAGAYVPVTIGDFVWEDLDSDGVQDAAEVGLGGVTVRVYDTFGTEVGAAVTAADGSYSIALPPGSYSVVVDASTLPAGFVSTTPGTVNTGALESGDVFDAADFGAVLPTFPVSGTVWNDANVDTVIDGPEARLGGVTVELHDGAGSVVATTLTAPDGTYIFPSVPEAAYTVAIDETTLPAGMSCTTGNNPEPIVVAGAPVADVDFGYAFPGTIDLIKNPATQQIVSGGTANFSVTVTNTGTQDLSGVAVVDPASPACNNTIGALIAGGSVTYACSFTGATADFTNVATVGGLDELGNTVADADVADVDVINPSIDIQKTPDLQSVLAGDDVTFTIRVENNGDVALTDVTVTDVLAPVCDTTFASMAAGAVQTYDCTVTNVTADFTNSASVTGHDPLGNPVTGSDVADVDVINPSIDIQKTPDLRSVLAGDDVTFTIRVENNGDVALTDVTVTDVLAPVCDTTFASMAAGAVQTYDCTITNVTADFTNSASVTGDHAAGGTVSDLDTAAVDVVGPAISIVKGPNSRQVLGGGTATFDITVTNTGDVALSGVTVTDVLAPACDSNVGAMAVGEVITYSCDLAGVAADMTNTASVAGTHAAGGTVIDSDTAVVDVIAPSIDIQKTPDLQQVLGGGTATFDITVTNTGDVALSGVTVTDVLAPACDSSIGAMAVGEVITYSCDLAGIAADLTNTALVTSDDPLGNPVTDSDAAVVDVIAPSIDIQKTPDLQQVLGGGTATFDITVTNTGDVALSGVTVTDVLAAACDSNVGPMAVGEVVTYSCDLAGVAADMTNTASVTGDDPLGNRVTDSDTAVVDVIVPSIDIQKTPDLQQVLGGGTATFDITVTNTGDVGLTGVTVTDALAADCDASYASMAAGAVETYTCTVVAGAADFTNTASVTGDDPLGNPVTDTDTADVDVIAPAIDIQKTPDLQTTLSGDDVTFTIDVTNTGDVALTNVAVTDVLAPACDNNIGAMAIGEIVTYTCDVTNVTADFTNTADVVADDATGGTVTDSDTADVDVVNPAIDIQKTPDTQEITTGGTATFSITVTNTGDTDLSSVAVTDTLAPACGANIGNLAASDSFTYSCDLAGIAADMTNTASVVGTHPAGGTVADSDTADVVIVSPSISIQKNPASQTLLVGETATFNITVTNTGDVDLNNVVVTDALVPACDAAYASLAAGAADTYTCTLPNVTADFTNVIVVAGQHPAVPGLITDSDAADVDVVAPAIDIQKTPDLQTVASGSDVTFTIRVENTGDADLTNVVVTDAQAPVCDTTFASLAINAVETYTCTSTGVTAGFTNTASVVGDEPAGGTVTDSDTAVVDVVAPAIDIEKTPDSQTVLPGGDATFTITVTNTGDVELTNVSITDALVPVCDATYASLLPAAVETYTCTSSGVTADFTNTASVVADDPIGGTVTDSDIAVIVVVAPGIDIQKTPDTQTVVTGADATFTITVTNTGTTALTDVTVTDALVPACDSTIGDMVAGAVDTYTCTITGVIADFTNTASVVGTHPLGGSVSDRDTAVVDVIAPAITITKDPAIQQILVGTDATFNITVTNTGDVDLTGVTVSDPLAPVCDNTIGDLAAGDSTTYSCSLTGVASDMTNTASVAGTDPLGATVSDSDTADVDVVAPAITIDKTPDSQQVLNGGTATFTITVVNTGDVDLTGVAVSDPLAPACDSTIGDLASGATDTYTCTLANVTAGFTNTASVIGTHPAGGTVTDSDIAAVEVIAPAITLVKDPATQQLLSGEDATFTITVTNAGDTPLTNVTLSDPLAPACDTLIPALGVGASESVTCAAPGVTSSFTNTASVVATHGAGGTVNDSDTADVEILVPEVDIQKTPDLQIVASGGTVNFDITVTNAGVVPLSNVVVTDALAPNCDAPIGALAVGASTTYSCSLSGVTADFTNTAAVAATDAVGNPAADSDTAAVDVVVPAISIAKSPDAQTVVVTGEATFSIEVTNTGDIDLTNVVVTDALAPNCDATFPALAIGASTTFTCTLAGIAADFTNTASVTADHAAGGSVSDSDTADVTVLVPAIDIQKTPDSQLVGPSGTATFTITVSNAGATDLSNVVVSDPLAPACDATFASLPVGGVESYTCTVPGVTADFTNTAGVTADDPLGNPVSDNDTADVDFVDPAITLSKTPDLQTLLVGEDASFSVTITNTGDTDLSNVVITDIQAPGCDATFASLAMGNSETVTCTVTGVAADFTNVAAVTADTPLGTTVTDSDDALVDVVAPGVDIQKTPDLQQLYVSDTATFTITVTNNGDQDLSGLVVTDPLAPGCDTTIATLLIGASASHTCTVANVASDFTNIASVSGVDALGNPVSDSDDAAVDVIDPSIDIQKTPDAQSVVLGGTATFDITVTNTGDVGLLGVVVADPAAPACDTTIGNLASGTSTTYTCSLSGVATDFTNVASVTGTDPIGFDVTDSDTADVSVLVPAIDIQKTPDLQQARTGDTVEFIITVTNAGETPLTGVVVSDRLAPGCDAVIGDLVVGETSTVICDSDPVTDDFTNTASVTGDDPLGNPVSDSDTADVDVIAPAIAISKSPDGQSVVTGGSATFTIEVTNTGDVDLAGVTVTDAAVPACDSAIGNLAVGASSSYTCSVSNVTVGFTNTASAVGTDPVGLNVTDSDTADVTVLVPGLDIQKTPDIQTMVEGDDATFTIIVTNTGQTDLLGVTVTDPLVPACDAALGDLAVGSGPVIYTCTATANNSFTNTALVAATDPMDNPLSDADTADVVALVRSNIAGTIAHDVAGDGAIDGTDTGFVGVDVTATWAGLDGVFGTGDDEVFVVQTDASGDYSFNLVPPGDYQIVVDTTDLPAGIDFQTLDPDGVLDDSTALTLPEDTSVVDVDFAYTATGSIGDTVFIDLDNNGTQQAGEPGVGGIDVTVTWHGPDGVLGGGDDLVFTTTTEPDGTYLVSGLPAGDFTVVIDSADIPTGLSGDVDQTVPLGPAEARDDVDFPLIGAGTIGDQVFEDLNHDGVFDSGEPGVADVTVTLTWAGPDGVIGTGDDVVFATLTDSNGMYLVDLLPSGEYLVELDDSTIPDGLGTAVPVTVSLAAGGTDLTADFPLVGNRAPVAVDDSDVTDEDTPVVITVLDDDSDPDGHAFAISSTTAPANGSVTVNPDGTIAYTPDTGFVGTDGFTYTICELDGVVDGVPATGLCDTAIVMVTINDVNEPPGPEASFQSEVVGNPLNPIPVFDPEGGPVTVTFISGDLPPGITMNPDGTFTGLTTEIGTYTILVEVCDSGEPQMCIEHTHTIAITPLTLPGPGDDPDPDDPPDTLPFTGANFGELLIAAMMMLLAGASLVLFSRKRREI